MKLVRRLDLALFSSLAVLGALAACGDGAGSSSTSNGGSSSTNGGGGATAQGAGGSGGDLFPTGGMGGATSTTTTTTTTTTSDPGGPCESASPTTATTLLAKKAGADDVQSALGVSTDAQGNIVVAGAFLGQIDFGAGALNSAGGNDAYVAKLNGTGSALWSKRFGDGGNQYAQHVATDAQGNVLVTGHFRGSVDFGGGPLTDTSVFFEDLFVAKLDGNGGHVWSKRYGDINNEESQAIATDPQGNVLFAGAFQKTINFGGGAIVAEDGGFNAFVAKLSALGDQQWAKSLGDMATEQKALGVTADKDGNVYAVGYFKGSIDLGGGVQTADVDKQSAFVVKYSPAGAFVWAKTWAAQEASGADVAVDAAGDVFVLGNFKGKSNFGGLDFDAGVANDVFLVKLDKDGNHVWSHRFGEKNKAEEATSLALDGDKPVLLGGFTGNLDFGGGALASAGGFDVFLAKLDSAGCQIHANSYGAAMLESGEDVSIDPSGNIVFAGSFTGTVDFGTGAITSASTDAVVVKTKP